MMTSIKPAELSALDLDILTQYTEAIGGPALMGSVEIFEQQFPLYMSNLIDYHLSGELKQLAEEAHKMKGAAGAIGLLRLGAISQKLQLSDACDWQENCGGYIKDIQCYYSDDVKTLKAYLLSC